MTQAFYPAQHATVNINVTSSSQTAQLTNFNGPLPVLVTNQGTATVWIAAADSTVTASSSNDIPIPAGSAQVFTFSSANGPLNVAAIAAGSTGIVSFTPGNSGI